MMILVDNLPSILIFIIIIFGFLWVFYPAWAVLIAERLEWDVEQLSSPKTQHTELPILSLVIPAYNEEERIPIMIRESFNYLASQKGKDVLRRLQSCAKTKPTTSFESKRSDGIRQKGQNQSERSEPTVEWLVVNDGSKDSTCETVREIYNNLINGCSVC